MSDQKDFSSSNIKSEPNTDDISYVSENIKLESNFNDDSKFEVDLHYDKEDVKPEMEAEDCFSIKQEEIYIKDEIPVVHKVLDDSIQDEEIVNLQQSNSVIFNKMAKRKEKKILRYEKADLQNALKSVRENNMSIKAASKLFNIPRTTLGYKLKGKLPEDARKGPKTVLSIEEENSVVQWIIEIRHRGFPGTKDQLLNSVKLLCKSLNKTTKFTDGKPGKTWCQLFLGRHPEVSICTPQNLTNSRASLTEPKIKNWFRERHKYFSEKNLLDIFSDPRRIFNSDESAFFMSPKGNKVLVQKGDKTVYSFINNDKKECLTVLMTVNAAGIVAPPMVVYSYERIPADVAYSVPPGWGIGKTESGWLTAESFFEYVANILYPWLIDNNIPLPILYFIDGYASHITLNLSDFCINHGIELIALYPSATHILQPLDVAVFRPMKQLWKGAVHTWRIENDGAKLTREHFAPLLKMVIKNLNQEPIVNSFRACGLCPFNSSAINFQKCFTNTKATNLDMQNKLTFLESIIGDEKVENFKRNLVELEDTSLYTVWTKIRNMINHETTVSEISDEEEEDAPTDVFQNIEENSQNNVKMKKMSSIKPDKSIVAGNKEMSPDTKQQSLTIDIPTPFKEGLPYAATSDSWRTYYENKQNKKKEGEADKLERKQKHEENKRKKEASLKEKEANRKKQRRTSSSSDSNYSDEVMLESDDDIEWDSAEVILESDDDIESDRASVSETFNQEDHIEKNTYVIVKYLNQYYPGKIKEINENDRTYFISSMVKSGLNYKWPLSEDCIWYGRDDIIKQILPPMPVNKRGAFKIPEMNIYE